MIIDCHGHYTTAPKALEAYRQRQIESLKDPAHAPARGSLAISDDEIRESLEGALCAITGRERNIDPNQRFWAQFLYINSNWQSSF